MSEHAKQLEPKIRRIQEQISKMAKENHAERLFQIAHRPGWTTQREIQFVNALLDSVTNQLEAADRDHRTLVAIADQIGRSEGKTEAA